MRKRIRKISQRQEKKAAEDVGGRVQAGSGNVKLGGGGDVRDPGKIRVECKYTEFDSYSLKYETMHKIKKHALEGGLEAPVLQLAFSKFGRMKRYAVVPWHRGPYPSDFQIEEVPPKSYRIQHDFLKTHLLNRDYIVLGFAIGARTEWFHIMTWDTFMRIWEKMHVTDQDY